MIYLLFIQYIINTRLLQFEPLYYHLVCIYYHLVLNLLQI